MIKKITVTLKGKNVEIHPLTCDVEHGSHEIIWTLDDDSTKNGFADPPITFLDKKAPFIKISGDGKTATCTDANDNNSGVLISYLYQVNLRDTYGPFAYPSSDDPKSGGDPYIRNQPK